MAIWYDMACIGTDGYVVVSGLGNYNMEKGDLIFFTFILPLRLCILHSLKYVPCLGGACARKLWCEVLKLVTQSITEPTLHLASTWRITVSQFWGGLNIRRDTGHLLALWKRTPASKHWMLRLVQGLAIRSKKWQVHRWSRAFAWGIIACHPMSFQQWESDGLFQSRNFVQKFNRRAPFSRGKHEALFRCRFRSHVVIFDSVISELENDWCWKWICKLIVATCN